MSAGHVRDTDGNEWAEIGVNAFQQRQLRCVSGARKGDVILDPRCDAPPPRAPYKAPRDPWEAALSDYPEE